ncbi:enoyl-CoA hydratase/isomerase family protein [Rhodoligotrophos defluvii]|uniref:enoyl-CoA hydratase/isomerase family protein n=1 Tax=Rhodoligotrophos defluvii TaxID=2561934 RepID=UPI0010C9AA15|nr:enoyl-CoA hydratase/isomerase family protein [Rhodoligotrophos defluvii]
MEASLLYERQGPILNLTLNRPRRLNALDHELRQAIASAIENADADPGVRVVSLTGNGTRAFSAGQDLHESAALKPSDGPAWMAGWVRYFSAFARVTKPLVMAVNGVAAGGGLETALLGDIRIASRNARFLMAEADIGLPAIVGQHLLGIHLGLSRTTELVLTARTLTADEACEIGLVHRVVEEGDLPVAAAEQACELADKPPTAMQLTVGRFREVLLPALLDAEQASARYQSEAVATGEPQQAMQAFFTRRQERQPADA